MKKKFFKMSFKQRLQARFLQYVSRKMFGPPWIRRVILVGSMACSLYITGWGWWQVPLAIIVGFLAVLAFMILMIAWKSR